MVLILMMIVAQLSLPAATPGAGLSSPQMTTYSEAVPSGIAVVPVDRDLYRLAAGDLLLVTIEGGVSEYLLSVGVLPLDKCEVSLDGYLNVSGIGSVLVEGRSITEAQQSLDALVRTFFPSLRARLSLSFPRVVNIDVRGTVVNPGRLAMFATQSVSDAIRESDGLRMYGSQYGHVITPEGSTEPVDLSIDPETGRPRSDPMLSQVASIEMHPCVNPLFINAHGAVSTYDIPSNGIPLEALLAETPLFTGNLDLPVSYLSTRDNRVLPIWSEGAGYAELTLMPGDTLNLVPHESTVFIGGAVVAPGIIDFRPGATIDWYIQAAGGYLVEADTDDIVVSTSGTSFNVEDPALYIVPPNSTVEVDYTWISKNTDYVSLVATLAGLVFTVVQLLGN